MSDEQFHSEPEFEQTANHSFGKFLKNSFVAVLASITFVVFIKLIWVFAFKVDGTKLIEGKAVTNLLERRAYLIDQTQSIDHIRAEIPMGLPSQIEGEMVISTCNMTTIALTNISFARPESRSESLQVIHRLIEFVIEPAQRQFDIDSWSGEDPLESLNGDHGHTWYLANVNFMIGAYKLLGGNADFDPVMKKITTAFCKRYLKSGFPMLESYPHECYCTDNVIAIASLANAERIFSRSSDETLRNLAIQCHKAVLLWCTQVKKQAIDPYTSGIAFRFDNGKIVQGARGIGIGWNCFYLPLIDAKLAQDQYKVMKERFVKKGLGVFGGLREYPNEDGEGDVDSGPVILGLSMSGTGFAIGAARRMDDAKLISDISFTIESAGCTVSSGGKRHYLLSPLVGEAVMLAMYSTTPWTDQFLKQPANVHQRENANSNK